MEKCFLGEQTSILDRMNKRFETDEMLSKLEPIQLKQRENIEINDYHRLELNWRLEFCFCA